MAIVKKAPADLSSALERIKKEHPLLRNISGFVPKDEQPIPTSLLGLNNEVGGFPRGAFTVLFGPAKSGKSTIGFEAIGLLQKREAAGEAGCRVLLVDLEGTNISIQGQAYLRILGVDTDNLMCLPPMTADDAVDAISAIASAGLVDMVFIDSIGAMVPAVMFDYSAGKMLPASQARTVSDFLKRLNIIVVRNRIACVCVSHIQKAFDKYEGDKAAGGNALEHYSSLTLLVSRIGNKLETDEENTVSKQVRITVVKNKIGSEGAKIERTLESGRGFDAYDDLTQTAVSLGVVRDAGAWVYFGDEKWNGKDKFSEMLRSDPAQFSAIYKATQAASIAHNAARQAAALEARRKLALGI